MCWFRLQSCPHLIYKTHGIQNYLLRSLIHYQQPYHPAAQDRLPIEDKQGWAGQYLDGRPPEKTRLLLEEVLVRPAGGAYPVVCVGPNTPV